MKAIILIFVSLISFGTNACVGGGSHPPKNIQTMIKEADSIYLVKVVGLENQSKYLNNPRRKTYTLVEVLKNIRGENYYFTIYGSVLTDEYAKKTLSDRENSHFNNHNDEAFWKDDYGRLNFGCFFKPRFVIGKNYLVFTSGKSRREPKKADNLFIYNHPKSAELVTNENDKWLKYIEKQVSLISKETESSTTKD